MMVSPVKNFPGVSQVVGCLRLTAAVPAFCFSSCLKPFEEDISRERHMRSLRKWSMYQIVDGLNELNNPLGTFVATLFNIQPKKIKKIE